MRCTAAKLGAKRGSHAHTTPHSGLVLHHASLCLHESLLLEQLLEGLVAVRAEVNALTLVAVLVEDHEIRIVVIDPPHFEELVVLEFFQCMFFFDFENAVLPGSTNILNVLS